MVVDQEEEEEVQQSLKPIGCSELFPSGLTDITVLIIKIEHETIYPK